LKGLQSNSTQQEVVFEKAKKVFLCFKFVAGFITLSRPGSLVEIEPDFQLVFTLIPGQLFAVGRKRSFSFK
jgi:hypothetical protein